MAQPTTFNPYGLIGSRIPQGLDAIGAAMPTPATATPDLLVDEVYNYVSSIYYAAPISPQLETQLKSIAYNVINSVRNNLVLSGNTVFNFKQAPFIQLLVGSSMTSNLPAISFNDRVADIEDNIGTSELSVNEQTPLFLATTTGKNTYTYFNTELADPTSDWKLYFSLNTGENYINTLYWGMEAMNGALAGYGAAPQGMLDPTTDRGTAGMVGALIGALVAAAGKVMFKWIPRITKPMGLSVQRVADFGNTGNPPVTGTLNTTGPRPRGEGIGGIGGWVFNRAIETIIESRIHSCTHWCDDVDTMISNNIRC